MCIHCLLFHSNLCWYVKYSLMLSVTGFGVGLLCVPFFFILKVPVVVDVTIFLSSFSYLFLKRTTIVQCMITSITQNLWILENWFNKIYFTILIKNLKIRVNLKINYSNDISTWWYHNFIKISMRLWSYIYTYI